MKIRGNHYIYLYTVLLWLKLYFVQRFLFDFSVQSGMDELLIVTGALSSAVFLSALALVIARKKPEIGLLLCSAFLSVLVTANVIYYRFFHDFLTVPVLLQSGNVSALRHSLFHLLKPWDLLLFIDTIAIALIVLFKHVRLPQTGLRKTVGALAMIFALCLTVSWTHTLGNAEQSEQSAVPDRINVVKQAGLVNYQLYDFATHVQRNAKKWFSEEEDLDEVAEQVEEWTAEIGYTPLQGAARGSNVVIISMESLQSFVLEREVAGVEVTPFLNELIQDSFYFTEFYDQTAQGKTSDAEFMAETSLYPLPSGSVFFLHADNEYNTLTQKLKQSGYDTAVFHANESTFWNRSEMYEAIGYDRFYDIDSFEVNEENSIGWGLNDRDFFEQSLAYLPEISEPFMGKWITLTNHHPFEIDLYEPWRARINTDEETVSQYFATVRFMDEALRHFFDRIRQEDWYERTVFILYGDHYGLSPHYYEQARQALGEEASTIVDDIEMQKVPLIIHIPGVDGQRIDTVGGHIDIKPTILNLLGIEDDSPVGFGHSMFAIDRPQLAVFRDGSFVTDKTVYYEQTCYDKMSGLALEADSCSEDAETAAAHLQLSDEMIYGDLLRFSDDGFQAE